MKAPHTSYYGVVPRFWQERVGSLGTDVASTRSGGVFANLRHFYPPFWGGILEIPRSLFIVHLVCGLSGDYASMPKARSPFVWQLCRRKFAQEIGRCPERSAWGSLVNGVHPPGMEETSRWGFSKPAGLSCSMLKSAPLRQA